MTVQTRYNIIVYSDLSLARQTLCLIVCVCMCVCVCVCVCNIGVCVRVGGSGCMHELTKDVLVANLNKLVIWQ